MKIFYHQQKNTKLRLKENEIRSARCWEDGTVLSRPGVKQIKYPCKIMTAVINRHRMMTPPPVIILRRKMTLLPEECVNFHNIGTVYTKKSHPCRIKTPYICRFQYHFLLLVKLSFTMLSQVTWNYIQYINIKLSVKEGVYFKKYNSFRYITRYLHIKPRCSFYYNELQESHYYKWKRIWNILRYLYL